MDNWKDVMQFHVQSEPSFSKQLEQKILVEIQMGRLNQGQKMPASRDLATFYQRNRKTIRKTYEHLIAQGWLYSELGKGTFVSKKYPVLSQDLGKVSVGMLLKGIVEFSDDASLVPEQEEFQELHMSPSLSDDFLFNRYLAEYKRNHFARKWLDPHSALSSLKKSIGAMAQQFWNLHKMEGNLSVYNSCQTAFLAIQSTFFQQSKVLAGLYPIHPQARAAFLGAGLEIAEIAYDTFFPDLTSLLKQRKVAAVYIGTSSFNAIASRLGETQKLKLIALAAAYDFYILEVDYLKEFWYGSPPSYISSMSADKTIFISSVSMLLPQLHSINYIIAPPLFKSGLGKFEIRPETIDPNHIYAISELIKKGTIINRGKRIMPGLKEKKERLNELLNRHLSFEATWSLPCCGFYLHLKLQRAQTTEDLYEVVKYSKSSVVSRNLAMRVCDKSLAIILDFGLTELRILENLLIEIANFLKKKYVHQPLTDHDI